MNNTYSNKPYLEDLYPESYIILFPLVREAVNEMNRKNMSPTPETIQFMVDEIVRSSGMWDEDEMDEPIARPYSMQTTRPPFRNRRGHHNRHTLRDIVRIILLRELLQK